MNDQQFETSSLKHNTHTCMILSWICFNRTLDYPSPTIQCFPTTLFSYNLHCKSRSLVNPVVTIRKRSCGKVMFLHLSVILFTNGGMRGGGACMAWWGHALHGGGHAWRGGGMCGRRDGHCSGRYALYWNAFLFDKLPQNFSCRRDSPGIIHPKSRCHRT